MEHTDAFNWRPLLRLVVSRLLECSGAGTADRNDSLLDVRQAAGPEQPPHGRSPPHSLSSLGERRELCLVKNISAGGALIRAYCTLEPDQRLRVELKEAHPVGAQVSWVRGSDAGLTFDQPVDVVELLKSSSDGPRPRMPRIEVSCVCFVREGAILHRALLHNISQGGVSVETASPLTAGAEVTVSLAGLPAQSAVVRWSEGQRYGITFNTVLALAALVEWLQSRQRG